VFGNEYLCRAIRSDNGELICGYFVGAGFGSAYLSVQNENKTMWRTYSVYEDTVCRCTGLADKNGTLIFEHDYVRTEYGRICEVVWKSLPGHCVWDLDPAARLDCEPPYKFDLWKSCNLEVVEAQN